jgi:hypothetical protein
MHEIGDGWIAVAFCSRKNLADMAYGSDRRRHPNPQISGILVMATVRRQLQFKNALAFPIYVVVILRQKDQSDNRFAPGWCLARTAP